jgi:CheY-like chemotaxis protein
MSSMALDGRAQDAFTPTTGGEARARMRVLVVDDDEAIREATAELLRFEGFVVEDAADGQEALERLDREPLPDVVLLDLMMPRIDGLEVHRRVRESASLQALPIVVMTASGRIRLLLEAGDVDELTKVIAKPFQIEMMLDAISTVTSLAPKARFLR